MGDIRFNAPETSSREPSTRSIDPYALVEALLGQKINREPTSETEPRESNGSEPLLSGYDDLDMKLEPRHSSGGGHMRPDSPPKDIRVGAVNPYALVEALLGRSIDKFSANSAQILSNVLQTDYDELFDMKHNSVLFAGLKLNERERRAERVNEKDMKIIDERDLVTPDLSNVRELDDLEKLGLKDLGRSRVKIARMQNGKLHLIVHAHSLGKTVSNREVTMSVNELVMPYRQQKGRWTPPNGAWRDMYDYFFQSVNKRLIGDLTMFQIGDRRATMHNFDDPTQGCASNSWLIAALFSVFWSDPQAINRATRVHQDREDKKRLAIRFHDKGGDNNNRTETVEVNYDIPINNSNNEPMYCRSSDGADIWPALYEKAFTKWITGSNSEQPDITQTHCGDPVKAMAQINGRDPHYFRTENHSAHEMLGLVRSNCVNFKTINPMTAWTYATGNVYRGSNIVANHAYSVLGYTIVGEKQYIILRNPWGVSEAIGLNSYPGLLERIEPHIWHPATMLDTGGLFAMEPEAFKHCFCHVGVAK
ncbi:Fc.00g105310.m01.CDS01 [Cosmosporella sp. VM-42]